MHNLLNYFVKKIAMLGLSLFISPLLHALTPYSTDELDELEKEFIQQINLSSSIIRSPLASQYINQIGKQLAQAGQLSFSYFFLVKSNEINAFAGPGGYIGINSALILATENESELAGVMAHELAHVRLHHLYRLIEHEKQMRIPMLASLLASAALGVINPTLGSGALMASLTGFAQDNINFTRAKEKEADRIGIAMLIRSGFDPRGMAGFFKKMQQQSRYYYTANTPAILRTHPLDEDRIAEAENRSANIAHKPHADHLDYHLFKELIRNQITDDGSILLAYYRHHCLKKVNNDACLYGYALSLTTLNHFTEAKDYLEPLIKKDPNNLFYQLALTQTEIGRQAYEPALKRLEELRANFPENYAVLMAYAQGLLAANKPQEAINLLLKGFRQFKQDLPLCELLAQANARAHKIAYAYFTEAQCQRLQGRERDALRKLKLAKQLAKNDAYLLARTEASIEDIKYLLSK